MIKVENIEVTGWKAAIKGMRNPLQSWDKSDTEIYQNYYDLSENKMYLYYADIGDNDLKLMRELVKAGPDHSKFLRFLNVTMNITAPLYWWKQFDTYKVATVSNSTSTMHCIHKKEFTLDDFSHEHVTSDLELGIANQDNEQIEYITATPVSFFNMTVSMLNICREKFLETKDKKFWWQMIQLLPSSYNQLRTVQLNYEVLRKIYFARKNHKLDEWRTFRQIMLDDLPWFVEIMGEERNHE